MQNKKMLQWKIRNVKQPNQDREKGASVLADAKRVLRKKILNLLRSQKEEDRIEKSRKIQKKLFLTPEFQSAHIILFYASFDGEVETFAMMKQARQLGKTIALPTIIKDRETMIPCFVEDIEKGLEKGPYGIQQPKPNLRSPVDLKDIDLAVVPAVAFDRSNNRLGRGAGYYDRFLINLSSTTPAFGLAFDFQIVPAVPHQKDRDVSVSRVISN